jgi:hypothetical protein
MTPAELQTAIDGKVKIRRMYDEIDLKQQDLMMASQTARLVNMINLRGKEMILKDDVQPDGCLVFVHGQKNKQPITEMTEEDMARFDNNMGAWGGVREHG